MDKLKPILARLAESPVLDYDTAKTAFTILLSGEASEAQIGAFLMALRLGEAPSNTDILTAGAEVLRHKAVPVEAPEGVLDTCGTGGDGANTYNISTATAFVVAGCGVAVAKHGNKAVSSRSGSSQVLEQLGIKLDIPPAQITRCIKQANMGFMFAPAHHSAMAYVAPVRAQLGIRTVFNLLGPLANPAGAKHQLMGVFAKEWLQPMAETLQRLGSTSAWIVCGSDGLDELTTTGTSHIASLKEGKITLFDLTPEEAGLPRAKPEDLVGGAVEDNAKTLLSLLKGEDAYPAYRDIVLLNAGAALVVAGRTPTIKEGVALAQEGLGKAKDVLARLIEVSNE